MIHATFIFHKFFKFSIFETVFVYTFTKTEITSVTIHLIIPQPFNCLSTTTTTNQNPNIRPILSKTSYILSFNLKLVNSNSLYYYIFIPRYYGGRPGEELARGLLRDKKQDEYPLSLQSDEKKDKVQWTKTENLIRKIFEKI